MTFTQDELATVLVALRMYQDRLIQLGDDPLRSMQSRWSQFQDCNAQPLSYDQANALADRINQEESPAMIVCTVKQGFVTRVYADAPVDVRVVDDDMGGPGYFGLDVQPLAAMEEHTAKRAQARL